MVRIDLGAIHNMEVHQMDFKNHFFFYGELEEEIYMEQPEGFVIHGQETKICKLDKSVYDLKKSMNYATKSLTT